MIYKKKLRDSLECCPMLAGFAWPVLDLLKLGRVEHISLWILWQTPVVPDLELHDMKILDFREKDSFSHVDEAPCLSSMPDTYWIDSGQTQADSVSACGQAPSYSN